ncbi:MAG: divergent polysaccharide deacetylase family protein [Gemmatimonadetes bacterium]|nr:MAG: divergent polysaccharide deacetylase family protein [Gemmatimonadota bacterium]
MGVLQKKQKVVPLSQRRQRKQVIPWIGLGLLLIVCSVVVSYAYFKDSLTNVTLFSRGSSGIATPDYGVVVSTSRPASSLGKAIDDALLKLGISETDIHVTRTERINGEVSQVVIRRYVDVPPTYPLAICNLAITRAVEAKGARVTEAVEKERPTDGSRMVQMSISEAGIPTHQVFLREKRAAIRTALTVPRVEKPTPIALIIDDFGPSLNSSAEAFLRLNRPITISILPYLPASKSIAKIAHREHKEILLHLPMEPDDFRKSYNQHVLLSVMTPERIAEEIQAALKYIPYVKGVNNHMGSKLTRDAAAMRAVMSTLKKEHKFFIDSMTSSESIAAQIAQEMGLPTARNHLFLDDEVGLENTQRRLVELTQIAAKQGSAIGIGHPHHSTLQAIQEMIPVLERKGYQFVFVSDLIH